MITPRLLKHAYVSDKLCNPLCFRYGDMGIKLEFDHTAPCLQEVLTSLMIRKKTAYYR